ncbi:helix-turn-helix domain-containing protein [Microbispora sp. CSR-4]|uniref:helix-turn-helix domain-containing protein n=1 Tax=Microbispora sp. CSR-4 TaxID=2592813 RepID=UPI0011C7E6BD|nr:helix-turn-helix domain-containing protein [Microbispora sp. CSR-4]
MTPLPPPEPRAYRVPRAAELLDLHPHTVRALIKSGRLKSVRVGRAYLIPESSIQELLAQAA